MGRAISWKTKNQKLAKKTESQKQNWLGLLALFRASILDPNRKGCRKLRRGDSDPKVLRTFLGGRAFKWVARSGNGNMDSKPPGPIPGALILTDTQIMNVNAVRGTAPLE